MKKSHLEKCVNLTKALRETDSKLRCQHFSFIFHKNRIITIGKNSNKSNPTNQKNPKTGLNGELVKDKYTCSELNAFIKFKNLTNIDFTKTNLVTTRIDRNGKIRNSKPCTSCQNLIKFLNPKKTFYSVDSNGDNKFEEYVQP